jgi:hypothetical protein
MWHWMRHLGGWAMRKLPLRVRARMHRHGLFFSYEKAGLVLAGWPIPPNADCVLIEAVLRLPISARRKEEFSLIVGSGTPVHPETLRHDEHDDHFHLFFRIPTPTENSMANLIWRNHSLGQLQLPVVGVDQIINTVKLQSPTLFVRVGTQNVACRSFVSTQCRGLLAAAVLTSEVPLASLVDLGLRVEFVNETSNQQYVVPVQLSSSQLACRQTMVTAEPPKVPRRVGVWSVRWKLGERLLHTHHLRAIGNTTFQRSLRMTDARFVVEPIDGPIYVRRQVPNLNECRRVGPCFLLASTQEGIAGLCHLEVVACVPGSVQMPMLARPRFAHHRRADRLRPRHHRCRRVGPGQRLRVAAQRPQPRQSAVAGRCPRPPSPAKAGSSRPASLFGPRPPKRNSTSGSPG